MAYDWILFDADNTLFDFNHSQTVALRQSIEAMDIPYQAHYLPTYHEINQACWRDFEKGTITQLQLRSLRFANFLDAIGFHRDPSKFNERYLDFLAQTDFLLPNARPLLEQLQTNFQLAIITNGLKEVQRRRIHKANLDHYFQAIIVSDEIGHAKPHAPFFEYTFNAIGHPNKSKVLVVGDSLNSDIRGGEAFGLDTCWVNLHQQPNLSKIKPTYEIHALEELLSIIHSAA